MLLPFAKTVDLFCEAAAQRLVPRGAYKSSAVDSLLDGAVSSMEEFSVLLEFALYELSRDISFSNSSTAVFEMLFCNNNFRHRSVYRGKLVKWLRENAASYPAHVRVRMMQHDQHLIFICSSLCR
jgi:hypothetical protein